MHFELPMYYQAADEVGMLLQSAKSISQSYVECDVSKPFALEQWRRAIVRVRNHPSSFAFSMGNEACACAGSLRQLSCGAQNLTAAAQTAGFTTPAPGRCLT